MTAEQFTYWLQGFMEVANPTTLDETQTQIIKDHLALVFDKQTPDRSQGLFPGWNPQNPPSPMTGTPIFPDPSTIIPAIPHRSYPDWTYRPDIMFGSDDCAGDNLINKKVC
jgi:hypothetical protein